MKKIENYGASGASWQCLVCGNWNPTNAETCQHHTKKKKCDVMNLTKPNDITIKFNINNNVSVKLTREGINHFYKYHERFGIITDGPRLMRMDGIKYNCGH
jgi:hypothetical protein